MTNTSDKPAGAAAMPQFDDFKKLMEQFQLPGVDVGAVVDWQRKDMEALAEANRQAFEGFQALAARRNAILQEAFAQWQSTLKDSTGPDAMSKGAEAARKGVEQAMANFRELADMEAQSRAKAWKVVQDRMQENMANLQKLFQPKKNAE
jgi:phasin family protein